MKIKPFVVKRKVFFNSKTGQASVTLPKKQLLKLFPGVPKEISIELRPTKW